MEKVILFKDSRGLSDGIEERLKKSGMKYISVLGGVNFDLGNVGLPAIAYKDKYYSGEEGFREFKKNVVNDLKYFVTRIRSSL